MSLHLVLKQVSADFLQEILNDKSLAEIIWQGWNSESSSPVISSHKEPQVLSLGTTWDALYFLITGEEMGNEVLPPLAKAIYGSAPIEEYDDMADWDYRPITYLSPPEVKEVAEALLALPEESLQARQLGVSANSYRAYSEEDLPELVDVYHSLVQFYKEAAEKGNAVLFQMD